MLVQEAAENTDLLWRGHGHDLCAVVLEVGEGELGWAPSGRGKGLSGRRGWSEVTRARGLAGGRRAGGLALGRLDVVDESDGLHGTGGEHRRGRRGGDVVVVVDGGREH